MIGVDIGYSNDKGKVFCNRNILLSVINLATKEVAGVASMCDNFGAGLKKRFSNSYYEGVKVNFNKEGILVNIYINVFSGYSVPDVAYKVQEAIKNGIASIIDAKVQSINVNVLGVKFGSEKVA